MLYVIATVELNAGQRDAFLKIFHEVMRKVQAEAGCIEYGPAVDKPTPIKMQSPVRDDVVTIIEKWKDLPALQKHLGQPHMIAYRTQVRDLVKGVKLQVLESA